MRVRDPTTSSAERGAAKVEPAGRGSERRRIRSSPGFAPLLTGAAAGVEAQAERSTGRAISRAPPARPIGTIDRLLVGSRAGEPEARVRIADGSPGGSEVRLIGVGDGRKIVAEILTASAGSRETLSDAMEEIRVRLRRRGIALSIAPGRERGGHERDRERRW